MKKAKIALLSIMFLLGLVISHNVYAYSASISGTTINVTGFASSPSTKPYFWFSPTSTTVGGDDTDSPFTTSYSLPSSVFNAGADGHYVVVFTNPASAFACNSLAQAGCVADSHAIFTLDYWRLGGVPYLSDPTPADPPFAIGSVGTNLVSGSGGSGAGALGIFGATLHDYGADIAIILGAIILVGVAYLVYIFGWNRIKGTAWSDGMHADRRRFGNKLRVHK